jgi:5-hydroxyisourate hydrolase-like protein (transthyretin family)
MQTTGSWLIFHHPFPNFHARQAGIIALIRLRLEELQGEERSSVADFGWTSRFRGPNSGRMITSCRICRRFARVLLTMAAGLLFSETLQAADGSVSGRVLDAGGQPVAGVDVARFWSCSKDRMTAFYKATTDADGRFSLKADNSDHGVALLAFDADQQRGALAVVSSNAPGAPLVMRLGPLVTVRGQFTCAELGEPVGWCNAYFSLTNPDVRLVQSPSPEATFFAKLPPGDYKIHGYGGESVNGITTNLSLTAVQPIVDMGKIDLQATPIGRAYGKAAPPWHVTEARGLPKNVQIADLRGKWVLVEFWGFW